MPDDEKLDAPGDPLLPRPQEQIPSPSDEFPQTQVGQTPAGGVHLGKDARLARDAASTPGAGLAWDDAPTGPIRVQSLPPEPPSAPVAPAGGRGRLIGIIAAALVAALAIATAVFFINRSPETTPSVAETTSEPSKTSAPPSVSAPATQVELEAAGAKGEDPFSESVAVTPVTEFPDEVVAVVDVQGASMDVNQQSGTLTSSGVEPALYGGSNDVAVCDVAALAEFLAKDEKKAAAWAFARGIAASKIPAYLAELAPVVLLHDTVVTNFGYADGAAAPFQTVLQAGTAVLIDPTGLPVVRCACGNPLAAAIVKNLPDAEFLGKAWPGFDPNRAVVVTPGAAVPGFTLVDVVTGGLFDVQIESTPPTSEPSAPPEGDSCEFLPSYGEAAWVEAEPGVLATCPEMIAKWREYENWTGPTRGQVQAADFPDGSTCGRSWFPPSTFGREADDGSIGGCTFADGRGFTIWRGNLGQHITQEGLDVGASTGPEPEAEPVPTPEGECSDEDEIFDNADYPDPVSCDEMIRIWSEYQASWPSGGYNDDGTDGWICVIPSADDPGECGRTDNGGMGLSGHFTVYGTAGDAGSGGAGEVPGGGAADEPEGGTYDLGLSVPMSNPSCDGMGIAVLGSFFTPGIYEAEVQGRLDQFPGSSYLRTDQSCSSLNPSKDGNAIYMVYQPVGYEAAAVCAVVNTPEAEVVGAYGKWLENTGDITSRISC